MVWLMPHVLDTLVMHAIFPNICVLPTFFLCEEHPGDSPFVSCRAPLWLMQSQMSKEGISFGISE